MRCPFCDNIVDKVVDSRESKDGRSIRRRRECLSCGRRFTTYERIDEVPLMVVKKDGRRETFDRNKLLTGLIKACEKRPVPRMKLEKIVDEIENYIQENSEKEVSTTEVGKLVMEKLQDLDKVGYVRFASVYREFKDVSEFLKEINEIFESKGEYKNGKSSPEKEK